MYKTISISPQIYNQINAIASRLKKPKAQVIGDLVKDYNEKTKEEEKIEREAFNAKWEKRLKKIKLPKGTKVSTDNIDEWFADIPLENF